MSSSEGNVLAALDDPSAKKLSAGTDNARQSQGLLIDTWNRLRKMPAPFVCFWITVFLLSTATASWLGVPLTPFSFDQTNSDLLQAPPTWLHPMGTDELGRDLLTRIIFGARLSISIGVFTAAV